MKNNNKDNNNTGRMASATYERGRNDSFLLKNLLRKTRFFQISSTGDFPLIKKIIAGEKAEALRIFQQADFQTRLEAKIETQTGQKRIFRSRPVKKIRLVPVFGSLLILLIFSLILKDVFFPPAMEMDAVTVERVLRQAGKLDRVLQNRAGKNPGMGQESGDFFVFQWSLHWALGSTHREKIADEDIPDLFYRVIKGAAAGRAVNLIIYSDSEGAYLKDIEKDLKIVRKEKNYRLFFSQIVKKLQEV